MATLNTDESPIADLIEWLDATVEYLNDDELDSDDARAIRGNAMDVGTALLNERIDELTGEQVRHVNDIVVALDRAGL